MKKNTKTEQSKQNHAIYEDIVISTNTLIWRTDTEGRFIFLNPAWENYGYTVDEMLSRPFSEFQMSEAAAHYVNAFRNCLIGEQIIGHETTYYSKKGDEVYLAINMIPLYDSSGAIAGTQGTAFDITERKHADELLQYISAKDELTGLYNLHTFLSMTEQQIKSAHREKMQMLIIYAGVDGMQNINEEYGQEAGDQLLIDIANILRKTFREADIFARTGGDEFVISTLVTSEDIETMIMERLNISIEEYNSDNDRSIQLSMSFGTAFYDPENPVAIDDVLSTADDRMHDNKNLKKSE